MCRGSHFEMSIKFVESSNTTKVLQPKPPQLPCMRAVKFLAGVIRMYVTRAVKASSESVLSVLSMHGRNRCIKPVSRST